VIAFAVLLGVSLGAGSLAQITHGLRVQAASDYDVQAYCVSKAESRTESQSEDSKPGCLNCGHCCAFHAAVMSSGAYDLLNIVSDNPSIVANEVDYGFASKLKRPPRFLV